MDNKANNGIENLKNPQIANDNGSPSKKPDLQKKMASIEGKF